MHTAWRRLTRGILKMLGQQRDDIRIR
jgi:hypothetical protein